MPKKKVMKPVINNNLPNSPLQFTVKGCIEQSKKVKSKVVFDYNKKSEKSDKN